MPFWPHFGAVWELHSHLELHLQRPAIQFRPDPDSAQFCTNLQDFWHEIGSFVSNTSLPIPAGTAQLADSQPTVPDPDSHGTDWEGGGGPPLGEFNGIGAKLST